MFLPWVFICLLVLDYCLGGTPEPSAAPSLVPLSETVFRYSFHTTLADCKDSCPYGKHDCNQLLARLEAGYGCFQRQHRHRWHASLRPRKQALFFLNPTLKIRSRRAVRLT